jgi:hypothetical protein
MTTQLFKIITSRDEIIIGMKPADFASIGGSDAVAIGRKLVAEGSLGLWQYAVRRGGDGALEQAPLRLISVLAHDSVRIEPYSSPLPIAG